MLFSIVKDTNISANDLNHDVDIIYRWAHQWKLEFNPDPHKQVTEVLISCKNNAHNHSHNLQWNCCCKSGRTKTFRSHPRVKIIV